MAPFSSCFPSYPPLTLSIPPQTHPSWFSPATSTHSLSLHFKAINTLASCRAFAVDFFFFFFLEVNMIRTPTRGKKCLNKCFVKRSQWKHSVKCQLSDWVIFLFNASVLLRGTWWLCHYATIQQIIIPFFFFLANFTGVLRPFLMNKIALSLYFSKFLCIFKKYLSWSIFILMLNI